jgi:hypothetical protein
LIQKIKFKSFRNPYEKYSVVNLGKSQCIAMLILYLDDRDALTLLSISTALYSACFGRKLDLRTWPKALFFHGVFEKVVQTKLVQMFYQITLDCQRIFCQISWFQSPKTEKSEGNAVDN